MTNSTPTAPSPPPMFHFLHAHPLMELFRSIILRPQRITPQVIKAGVAACVVSLFGQHLHGARDLPDMTAFSSMQARMEGFMVLMSPVSPSSFHSSSRTKFIHVL